MVFVAILTIIILLKVPHLSNIMYTPNITASHSVIEVEFDSKTAFWTAEVNISVYDCNSSVIVVQGKMCSSLPTTERNDSIYDTHMPLSPVYFLQGSYMNLSDIDNFYTNKILWILSTKDYLGSKNGLSIKEECDPPHECDSPNRDSESCCYHIKDYAGGNILHQIMKSDFYFATSWPKPEYHTFDVFYTAVVYDLDAIIHLPGAKVFPRTAKISDWFEFQSTKCILLNTTCPSHISGLSPIALSNVSRRTDILLLALILEFVVSVVGTGLALLCKFTVLKDRRCRAKRSTATYEEFEPSDATAL
ncbi:MAG: hypothetical protein MJE68_28345, partial [Proteobacteria bacterium]|nr:hypothetical protein [Pseudomonadota bacterium]